MTRFLVTGASGLLGLTFALQYAGEHEVTGVVNSRDLAGVPFPVVRADLTEPGRVARLLDELRPEVILNCAALAQPDLCEKDPLLTERINARMPGELALAARHRDICMVHISTDAVFDGRRGSYLESDATGPLNIYARSKLAGEQSVIAAYPDALIARVVFFGWSLHGERSLSEFFYNNLSAGHKVKGFTDAIFSPLQVNDLADLLMEMAQNKLCGLYHVYSSESVSKYEFGLRIARRFGLDENLIEPASIMDGNLTARRSANLAMRVEKLSQALGHDLPGQDAGIERLYGQWREGYAEQVKGYGNRNS
jgi:dTDP-4-dehydrorhamnose reductase